MDFTYREVEELLGLFGKDEETEISVIEVSKDEPSHSGPGKYAYATEYPDEGSQLLGEGYSE